MSIHILFLAAPEIQLNVGTGGLFAGKDLTAECEVISANPAVEKFVWKIGNYELSESSSKIVIEDLSHLYHGEKISCFAENSVAVMSEEQLLDIKCEFLVLNNSFTRTFLIAIFSKSFIFDRDKWIIR